MVTKPDETAPALRDLPPLPKGIEIIPHTHGSIIGGRAGGREHPDPDGEECAIPNTDGSLTFQGNRYRMPTKAEIVGEIELRVQEQTLDSLRRLVSQAVHEIGKENTRLLIDDIFENPGEHQF